MGSGGCSSCLSNEDGLHLVLSSVPLGADVWGRMVVSNRGPLTKDNIWIPVMLRFLLVPLVVCSVKGKHGRGLFDKRFLPRSVRVNSLVHMPACYLRPVHL